MKLSTKEEVADFYRQERVFWNEKIFNELVLARKEAKQERDEAAESRKREEAKLDEMIFLMKNSTCEEKYQEYFLSDIRDLHYAYWYGEQNRMTDMSTVNFIWFQRAGVLFGGIISIFGTVIAKFFDDRSASNIEKTRKIKAKSWQKVI